MSLDSITNCHVCGDRNLRFLNNVIVQDPYSGEDMFVKAIICLECDTVHYIYEGETCYEFSVNKINKKLNIKIDNEE